MKLRRDKPAVRLLILSDGSVEVLPCRQLAEIGGGNICDAPQRRVKASSWGVGGGGCFYKSSRAAVVVRVGNKKKKGL